MTLRIEPEPLECWCQDYLLEINKCIIAQPNYKSIRFRVKELISSKKPIKQILPNIRNHLVACKVLVV